MNHSFSAPALPVPDPSSWNMALDHQPVSWQPGLLRGPTSTEAESMPPTSPPPTTSVHRRHHHQAASQHQYQYLDPNHRGSGIAGTQRRRASDPEALRRSRLKQLRRQLGGVRRRMEEVQLSFEANLGYKASQADRKADKTLRRLMNEQSHLKKQIKNYSRDLSFEELLDLEEEEATVQTMPEEDTDDDNNDYIGGDNSEADCYDDESNDSSLYDQRADSESADNNNSAKSRDLEAMRNTLLDIEQVCRNVIKGFSIQIITSYHFSACDYSDR